MRSYDDAFGIKVDCKWGTVGKSIVSRFKGRLIKVIKRVNGRYVDYTISPMIRQSFVALWLRIK